MNKKGFSSVTTILVALGIILVGGAIWYFYPKPVNIVQNQPNGTANWQTYNSSKYGFEFKYPNEFGMSSSGPNEEQKKLNNGEAISGTIPPSYDTITFSDSNKKEQFNVVLSPNKAEISPNGFNYLSMGNTCDARWIDSVSEGPTLLNKNGIPILEVRVIPGGPRGGGNASCYYIKSSDGNLIVFNVSGNILPTVVDQILSTFKFISPNPPNQGSPIKIVAPVSGTQWIQGNTYDLKWTGGGKQISIFLIDKSLESVGASISKAWTVYNIPNVGYYSFMVPVILRGDYKFYLSDEVSNYTSGDYFRIIGH